MQVTVRAYASLKKYLPDGGQSVVEVAEGTTAGDLITLTGLPAPQVHLIIRNNRQAEAGEELEAGDVVAFFPPVAGG